MYTPCVSNMENAFTPQLKEHNDINITYKNIFTVCTYELSVILSVYQ